MRRSFGRRPLAIVAWGRAGNAGIALGTENADRELAEGHIHPQYGARGGWAEILARTDDYGLRPNGPLHALSWGVAGVAGSAPGYVEHGLRPSQERATKQSELHYDLASPEFMARDLKLSRLVDLLIRATHKYERRDVLPLLNID